MSKKKELQNPDAPASLPALIEESRRAARRGDLFKARDLLFQVLAIDPANVMARFEVGLLLEGMGNNPPGIMSRIDLWQDALKHYEALMVTDQTHVEARMHAGYTHLRFGEYVGDADQAWDHYMKALACFDAGLHLDPAHAAAWHAKGYSHLHLKQQHDAIDAFTRAVAIDPQRIESWWNLGILHDIEGNYKISLEAFETVQKLDPKRLEADEKAQRLRIRLETSHRTPETTIEEEVALGDLATGVKLVKESNFPKAIQFLSRAREQFQAIENETGQLEAGRYIATACKGLHQWPAAKDALLGVHVLAGKRGDLQKVAEAAHDLGFVAFRAGNMAEAIERFTEAITFHRQLGDMGKVADGLANLGRSYKEAKEYRRALSFFKESLEIDTNGGNEGNQGKDHLEIAETCKAMNDLKQAISHYEEAAAIYQQLKHDWKATEIRDVIKKLRRKEQEKN